MSQNEGGTVWVLGAGFSKSLGGPLLVDLFSRQSIANLETRFPVKEFKKLHDDRVRLVVGLYLAGTSWAEHLREGRETARVWANAEEFLDYLDTAAAGGEESPAWKRIVGVTHEWLKKPATPKTLVGPARRLLAAECAAFSKGADPDSETWEPYRLWFKGLTGEDTIITFNYDRVLEMLNETGENSSGLHVAVPGDTEMHGGPRVFKLHGSVDWQWTGKELWQIGITDDPFYAVTCEDEESIAIAMPGPSKRGFVGRIMNEYWNPALKAVQKASRVFFLGYRFPPTDSSARRLLLSALGANTNTRFDVHVVLGPDVQGEKVRRMSELLRFTMLRKTANVRVVVGEPRPTDPTANDAMVHVHALYVEDFLTVYNPASLKRL